VGRNEQEVLFFFSWAVVFQLFGCYLCLDGEVSHPLSIIRALHSLSSSIRHRMHLDRRCVRLMVTSGMDSGRLKAPEENYLLFFRKEWQVWPLFSGIYRAGYFLPSPK